MPQFRRVAAPTPGTKKRINVQIDPSTWPPPLPTPKPQRPEPETATADAGQPQQPVGSYDWFWQEIPPQLARGPGRTQDALRLIERTAGSSQDVPAPRLDDMRKLVGAYGIDILTSTLATRVSPALVLAVISVESSGRADAVSPAGASGLMQLMPATAKRFNVSASDPRENIRGGVAYLDWLLREFDGDEVLALAGYNAGEGAVRQHDGVPPYKETRAYVPKVLSAWRVARMMCQTPPEYVADGCVFGVNVAQN